eukprot:4444054-Amphidinium_carterae.1
MALVLRLAKSWSVLKNFASLGLPWLLFRAMFGDADGRGVLRTATRVRSALLPERWAHDV